MQETVKLNIHVKLTNSSECYDIAKELNANATAMMAEQNVTNLVNFEDGNDPHITLYMTDFLKDNEQDIID